MTRLRMARRGMRVVPWWAAVLAACFTASTRVATAQDGDVEVGEILEGDTALEDVSLEELLGRVTAVSRREESVATAPATVTVITRGDFERFGWRSVAEALRSVPGLYVSWGRDYYHTGVRGISIPRDVDTRILVLIDGHTMNNRWSAASNTGELLTLPPSAIERVEVMRGPGSSIYGSNAFFAVVNIVTRRAGAADAQHAATFAPELGVSSIGWYRATATARRRFGEVSLNAFAVGIVGDGAEVRFNDMTRPGRNRGAPTPTHGVTSGTDYERGFNVGGLAAWRDLTLELQWADRWKGLPSAPNDARFDDPWNSVADEHALVDLRYAPQLAQQGIVARVYYDLFRNRQFLHRDPTDWLPGRWHTDDPHTVEEGNSDSVGLELQDTIAVHERDTVTVGAEVRYDHVSQPSYEIDPLSGAVVDASIVGGIKDAQGHIEPIDYVIVAAYAQNEYRPVDPLRLVAGVRFDYNSIFSRLGEGPTGFLEAFAPRAAAIYSLSDKATLKLLYGEAFREPSVFEAFFDDGVSVCGNPDARSERLRSVELSGIVEPVGAVTLTSSVYYTHVSELLVREPVPECYVGSGPRQRFVNRGSVDVLGAEAGVDARVDSHLRLGGSAATFYAREEVEGHSGRPPNSPVGVVTAAVAIPFWRNRLVTSFRAQLVTQRLNWTYSSTDAESPYLRLEAAVVGRRIVGGLNASITATAATALDSHDLGYRDPVTSAETIPTAIPQEDVSIFATVGYEL